MALGGDLIKEYLVGLGFKVDEKSLSSFNKALDATKKSALGIVGVMAAAATGIVKFVDQMYKKDQQLEKDAKSMRKSVEQTRAYTNALQVMGVTAEQLKKDKSLRAIHKELEAIGMSMALPEGNEGIDTVKNLMQSFQKLKLTATYALDWINYKIKTVAAGPLKYFTDFMGRINLSFQANLPAISEWVAIGVKAVLSFIQTLFRIGEAVFDILSRIPAPILAISAAVIGLLALIRAGPIAWITAAIAAIFLLLDDLFVYLDGGEALLGPFWEKCIEWVGKAKEAFDKLKEPIEKIKNWFGELLTKIQQNVNFPAAWENIKGIFSAIADAIVAIVTNIGTAISGLLDLAGQSSLFEEIGNLIQDTIVAALNLMLVPLELLHGALDALVLLLQGDLDGAWEKLKQTGVNTWNSIKAALQPLIDRINNFLKPAIEAVKGWFETARDDTGAIDWSIVGDNIRSGIEEKLTGLSNTIKGWLGFSSEDSWLEVGIALWNGAKEKLTNISGTIKTWLGFDSETTWLEIGIALLNGIKSKLTNIGDFIKGLMGFTSEDSWLEVGVALWNGIKEKLSNLGDTIKGWIGFSADDSWTEIGSALWNGLKEILSGVASDIREWITGVDGATWTDVGNQIAGWIGDGITAAAGLITAGLQVAFDFIAGLDWSSFGTKISNTVNRVKFKITNMLGWTTMSFDQVQEVVNSFSMPESMKMSELETAKENVNGIVTEITNLQNALDEEVLKLQLGVEFTDEQASNFGEMLDNIIEGGIEAVESNQYNMNLNIASIFGEGSADYATVADGLLNPFFEAVTSAANEQGAAVREAYVDAMADGTLTAQEAAKLAAMARQFEAEVNNALSQMKIKAKMLQLEVEGGHEGLLKPGDIKNIVDATYKIVGEAFDIAHANKEETISLAFEAAAYLDLDATQAKEYVDMIRRGYLDQLSSISLEGINNVFNTLNDHLETDALMGHLDNIMSDMGSRMLNGMETTLDDLGPAAKDALTNFFDVEGLYDNDFDQMNGDLQARVKSLVEALKPNIDDLNRVKAEYEEAGLALPQGMVDAFERVDALTALSGSNHDMFQYLRDSVVSEMEETGATYEEAMTTVLGDVATLLSTDLTIPNAMQMMWDDVFTGSMSSLSQYKPLLQKAFEDLEIDAGKLLGAKIPEDIAQGLADNSITIDEAVQKILESIGETVEGTPVEAQVDVEPKVNVDNVDDITLDEQPKMEVAPEVELDTTALEGSGEKAGEAIATGMEKTKPTAETKAEEISDAVVQQFLLKLTKEQGLEIAQAFAEGIIEGIQEAYDRAVEIWTPFPEWLRKLFNNAKNKAVAAMRPIVGQMQAIANQVKNAFNDIPSHIGNVFDQAANNAISAFSRVASEVAAQVAQINASISSINTATPNVGGGTGGGKGGTTPTRNAAGGVYDSPVQTTLVEDGWREYVIPIGRPDRAIPLLRAAMSDLGLNAESFSNATSILGGNPNQNIAPAYAQPYAQQISNVTNQSGGNIQVQAPVTVYSNDPAAAGSAVQRAMERRLVHNMKGRLKTT